MTKRREFPQKVKVAIIRRATRDGVAYCEKCGAQAKRWQIDHIIADSHGGEPVIENAELICEPCYSVKNPQDTTIAAKIKRQTARHIGIKPAGANKLKSAGFPSFDKEPKNGKVRIDKGALPALPPRQLYRDA